MIVERVLGALGLGGTPGSMDETLRAFGKLFDAIAREQPLVVVLEDLHWAEPALLDLVEQLGELADDSPLFVLGLARPELLEKRPGWGHKTASLALEPLSEASSQSLIDALLGEGALAVEARRRIVEAAEGNPLFVEQMLAMVALGETRDGEPAVPPTIRALLAARLDRLGPGERAVLETAAVIGKEFYRDAIGALLPAHAGSSLEQHLQALVRKEFVRAPTSRGEGTFRFWHILILDAAYRGIPKAERARLHEGFAEWLEARAGEAPELDEILAHHLEQAYRYRAELGRSEPGLAERAVAALSAPFERALARYDHSAIKTFAARADALLPPDDPRRFDYLIYVGAALRNLRRPQDAEAVLLDVGDRARAVGDHRHERIAAYQLAMTRAMATPSNVALAELARTAEAAVGVFADGDDHVRLSSAVGLVGWARIKQGQLDAGREALLEAAAQARMSGDRYREAESLRFVAEVLVVGDEHVDAAIAEITAMREQVQGQPLATAHLELYLAVLECFRGRFEMARALSRRARDVLVEFDNESGQVESLGTCALVDRYAGDLESAEAELRDALALASSLEDGFNRGWTASRLAEVLALRGRDAEASAHLATAEGLYETAPDLGLWRSVRARLLVRAGARVEALSLAREAVELARGSGTFVDLAHRLFDLGEVLRSVGWDYEARTALQDALAMFERKGDVVYGAKTRELLDGLRLGAAAS